jgi:hypothetical protein
MENDPMSRVRVGMENVSRLDPSIGRTIDHSLNTPTIDSQPATLPMDSHTVTLSTLFLSLGYGDRTRPYARFGHGCVIDIIPGVVSLWWSGWSTFPCSLVMFLGVCCYRGFGIVVVVSAAVAATTS